MEQQSAVPVPEGFRWTTITPPVEGWACRFLQPTDWELAELPQEEIDFSASDQFLPLAVCIARFGACVFSAAVRPKYADGTVADWFVRLAREQGCEPEQLGLASVGEYDAVGCFATQQSDMGPMRMRLSMFEDGGNLYNVSAMAPVQIWSSVEPVFLQMVGSFTLAEPKGPTVPLASENASENAEDEDDSELTFADHALADDLSSLQADHPINANFRDSGVGLVPNLVAVDLAGKSATVAAGAIVATFSVPLGWHIIDDGKRTLVFSADGEVQINFNLLDPEGLSDGEILMSVLQEMQTVHPALEYLRLELGGMKCLALRNIMDGDTALEQAYLIRPAPGGLMLKTRVTAVPARIVPAMDLCGLILERLNFLNA